MLLLIPYQSCMCFVTKEYSKHTLKTCFMHASCTICITRKIYSENSDSFNKACGKCKFPRRLEIPLQIKCSLLSIIVEKSSYIVCDSLSQWIQKGMRGTVMIRKDSSRDSTCRSGCMEMHDQLPCDMILRSDTDVLTPVIFFNKDLPEVLSCISREILSRQNEQLLTRKLFGMSNINISVPLDSWYKSILADIYKVESNEDSVCKYADSRDSSDSPIPVSFCLQGEIFAPMPQSAFLFVTLTLPPLWQKMREADDKSALSVCSPKKATSKSRKYCLFKFLYFPDKGLWYAAQSGSAKKLLSFIERQ